MKKLFLRFLITLITFNGLLAKIEAQVSMTAGNGGDIISIEVNPNTSNINYMPDSKPNESYTTYKNQTSTTITVNQDSDSYTVTIAKPGINTNMTVNNETGIINALTTTEYGTTIKTELNKNTGTTSSIEINSKGEVIKTIIDYNKQESVATKELTDGSIVVTTIDLTNGVSEAVKELKNDIGEIISTKTVTTPTGSEVIGSIINNKDRDFTVLVASVVETTTNKTTGEIVSKKEFEKYIELTKLENALDFNSFNANETRSNVINLVPSENVVSKIPEAIKAQSINEIPEYSYASDFYELQAYFKDDIGNKEVTHEGLRITVYIPEYITDNVDAENCGVIHYEQSEDVYEYIAADNVDVEAKTMTFTLRSTSPISYVISYLSDDVVESACPNKHIVLAIIAVILFLIGAILNLMNSIGFYKLVQVLLSIVYAVYLFITKHCYICKYILISMIILLAINIIIYIVSDKDDDDDEE